MNDKVNKIIDKINDLDMKKELDNIKLKIRKDPDVNNLINKFNISKENYEKYNLKDEFLINKKNLLNNDLIKKYITIQNEINMLTLHINTRLNSLINKK